LHDRGRLEIVIASRGVKKGSVLHEVGHALDAMRDRPSQKPSFGRIHEYSRPALERNHEHYLLQPGGAGLSECFAEAFSRYSSTGEVAELRRDYPDLYNYFHALEQMGWVS
jgi:hypothetical protein